MVVVVVVVISEFHECGTVQPSKKYECGSAPPISSIAGDKELFSFLVISKIHESGTAQPG